MLRDLHFRTKMLLVPATATAAFLVVFGVNVGLGARERAALDHIEREHVPSLEAAADLEVVVRELQRALQDAVAARDAEAVRAAASFRARFLEKVSVLEVGGGEHAEAQRLRGEFDAVWTVARDASLHAIAGGGSAAGLQDVSRRFRTLDDLLAAQTRREREDLAEEFDRARQLQRATAFATLVGTGVGVLLLALLARSVVRGVVLPVLALARAAQHVADGDLAQATPEVGSNDELGELARSFGAMVARLRAVPRTLRETVEELGAAVAEVEVASAEQAPTLERQVAALARSRSTAERLLRESHETSLRAETVLRIAGEVEAFGDAAQLAARESLIGLGEISEQVKQVTGGIALVARHTQSVGELVATMKRLAAESSELAMSVSVEAARLGAAGGPLAEASRLLKDLATRSAQTSARITRALADAEGAISGVSTLSEESKRRMGKGLDQVRRSADSLREITAVVQKSGKAARGIVSSVSEQGSAIAELTTGVLALDEAMAHALRDGRRVQGSTAALKRASGRLAGVVQSFKV